MMGSDKKSKKVLNDVAKMKKSKKSKKTKDGGEVVVVPEVLKTDKKKKKASKKVEKAAPQSTCTKSGSKKVNKPKEESSSRISEVGEIEISKMVAPPTKAIPTKAVPTKVVKEQAVKGKKFKKPKKRPKKLHVVQPSKKASKKQATEADDDTSSSSSDDKDMEIVKIGKKAPTAKLKFIKSKCRAFSSIKKKDDSSSSSDETDTEDTTPPKPVAKPTNDAKDSDSPDDSSSDDDSEEAKEPAKASTKRKQEESESDSDDDSSDESETHNVPQAKKMKKGGFGSIGGQSMSKASEPELLSNLRAIHETIRSLDEQIKLVSEKISCYQDVRKSCWTSYTETNVPETTSWELSIVWELDNVMIPSLKNHESMMMKLELEKCALQSLYKGFFFRVLSDDNNKKMTFCLVDIYRPVYREVYLDASTSHFPSTIPLDVLPDILKPCSQIEHKKDRNVTGKYVKILDGKYIYVFDTPLCARSATLDHFIDVVYCDDDLTVALTTVDIRTPFIPVKQVFSESVIETAAEVIVQALGSIDANNFTKSIRATVKEAFDDVWSKPLESVTINNNQQLVNWLEPLLCNDSFVISEERFASLNYTYYQNSKTGCCVLMKNSPNGVVIQSVQELEQEMDEDEEQQVESSENRTLSQLLASMMTAAGQVAERSIQRGRYCKEIIIYGVICNFESNEASLCKLILNFERGDSKIIKYMDEIHIDQPQFSSIDRMILYAVNQSFNH